MSDRLVYLLLDFVAEKSFEDKRVAEFFGLGFVLRRHDEFLEIRVAHFVLVDVEAVELDVSLGSFAVDEEHGLVRADGIQAAFYQDHAGSEVLLVERLDELVVEDIVFLLRDWTRAVDALSVQIFATAAVFLAGGLIASVREYHEDVEQTNGSTDF